LDEGENPYQDKYKVGEFIFVKGSKGYENIDFVIDVKTTTKAFGKAREPPRLST